MLCVSFVCLVFILRLFRGGVFFYLTLSFLHVFFANTVFLVLNSGVILCYTLVIVFRFYVIELQ